MSKAEGWAHHACLRSARSCTCFYCRQFTVEEALFMCVFELWREEYGPGWEGAIE